MQWLLRKRAHLRKSGKTPAGGKDDKDRWGHRRRAEAPTGQRGTLWPEEEPEGTVQWRPQDFGQRALSAPAGRARPKEAAGHCGQGKALEGTRLCVPEKMARLQRCQMLNGMEVRESRGGSLAGCQGGLISAAGTRLCYRGQCPLPHCVTVSGVCLDLPRCG